MIGVSSKPDFCGRSVVIGRWLLAGLVGCACLSPFGVASDTLSEKQTALRRPVSAVFSDDGSRLLVANQASGSVSIVDVEHAVVEGEIETGGQLTDLTFVGEYLVACDTSRHRLVSIPMEQMGASKTDEIKVASYPNRLCKSADDSFFVSSLWSRTITKLSHQNGRMQHLAAVTLPFEPLEMALSPGEEWLVVASAFEAQLAVVSVDAFELQFVTGMKGHNIRGMSFHDGSLLLAMQHLNPLAHSTQDDIHWGNMISNMLVELPFASFIESQAAESVRIDHQLGEPESGAGDPSSLLVGLNSVLVVLSGVNQLGKWSIDEGITDLRDLGEHPVAIASHGPAIAVINRLSDSVSLMRDGFSGEDITVSLGSPRALQAAERGEKLFYDSRLSHDGWLSCHSCHSDGHSNGQLNDNMSDGGFGSAKRVPSLLGVAETGPWSWLGRVESLEEQVRNSIETTMRGPALSDQEVEDLVAYMQTLRLPSVEEDSLAFESTKIDAGKKLFHSQGCSSCHAGFEFTSPRVYDVGLKDELGNGEFNPPSLRGVRFRKRVLHDGRAESLRQLFNEHHHQLKQPLSEAEIEALVCYLKSLD